MRRFARFAAAARDLAARARRRADRMPRLPFLVALAVSVALLAAAVDALSGLDERIADVEEATGASERPVTDDGRTYAEIDTSEVEIVEYGFGMLDDPHGGQRVILGAVIRNPLEEGVIVDGLRLSGEGADGSSAESVDLYLGFVPPESEVTLGKVLLYRPDDVHVDSLRLTVGQVSAIRYEPSEEDGYTAPARPVIEMLGVEPLVAPEGGHRLNYRITIDEEDQFPYYGIAVVFRDEDGGIVGGIPVADDPFAYVEGTIETRAFPVGTSVQHVDLTADLIPAGADLSRTEVGVGI